MNCESITKSTKSGSANNIHLTANNVATFTRVRTFLNLKIHSKVSLESTKVLSFTILIVQFPYTSGKQNENEKLKLI